MSSMASETGESSNHTENQLEEAGSQATDDSAAEVSGGGDQGIDSGFGKANKITSDDLDVNDNESAPEPADDATENPFDCPYTDEEIELMNYLSINDEQRSLSSPSNSDEDVELDQEPTEMNMEDEAKVSPSTEEEEAYVIAQDGVQGNHSNASERDDRSDRHSFFQAAASLSMDNNEYEKMEPDEEVCNKDDELQDQVTEQEDRETNYDNVEKGEVDAKAKEMDTEHEEHQNDSDNADVDKETKNYEVSNPSSSGTSRAGSLDSESLPASTDSGIPISDQAHHKFFVVAAIDFGTAFSGYAFAFTRDPDSIHMMRKWEGGDPGVTNQKIPTTLLLKPDGTFHSFGFGARDYYHDLEPDEAKKWLYFEKFKMTLHSNQYINKNAQLKAANGKRFPAVIVFAHALRFFKSHVLEELSDQSATQILEEDIGWVLTVPAIWRAPAKQFMRTAAYEAGLTTTDCPERLLIALEPEAASIYCRKLRIKDCILEDNKRRQVIGSQMDMQVQEQFKDNKENNETKTADSLPTSLSADWRTRYVVVDCGGGTVDLTVHELDPETATLTELHKGTGGAAGAMAVDEEFEKLLKRIFGEDFIKQFQLKRPAGWVDLMIAFEAKKRTAHPNKANPLNISLPYSFIDYYKKNKSSSIDSVVKKYGDPNIKWSSQGMLRLGPDVMRGLFKPVLDKIVQHVDELISKPGLEDLQFLFLVGGFAESPLLHDTIRTAFGNKMRVIIPQDVSLTILKGAVLFGLDPTVVRVRCAALTYGVGVLNRFIEGSHPPEKLVKKNGVDWCTDIFDTFVQADQPITLGHKVTRSYAPAKPGQKSTAINIYCSENENVMFITDNDVRRCGQIIIELPELNEGEKTRKPRELQATMQFGDTEIKVSAVDIMTGLEAKASIDFLSN